MSKKGKITISRLSGGVVGNVMSLTIQDENGMIIRGRVSCEDLMCTLTGAAEVPLEITRIGKLK